MILYHGSNVEIKEPKIITAKRLLDFGTAFYTTSDFEQAAKWALRAKERYEAKNAIVSVFEFENAKFDTLQTLVFDSAGKDWLEYVCKNRTNKIEKDDYDIVIGPVANDQVIRTVNNYLNKYFSEEIALQLLKTQKLKDQYAFKTQKALTVLHFMEAKIL